MKLFKSEYILFKIPMKRHLLNEMPSHFSQAMAPDEEGTADVTWSGKM
jgi:hypothetical protein